MDVKVVNAEERPEDAARRYAGYMVQLEQGLKDRGVDLSAVREEDLVKVTLECLDEAIGAARVQASMHTEPRTEELQRVQHGLVGPCTDPECAVDHRVTERPK